MTKLICKLTMLALVFASCVLILGCNQQQTGSSQSSTSHGNILTLTEGNFKTEVLSASQPVLVDFWATWCGPCKIVAPVVEELSNEYKGRAKFGKVDIDAQPDLAKQYNITAIPALLYFKDGKMVEQVIGAQGKAELKSRLDKLVSK